MAKRNLHPQWFPQTQVFCDGVLVMVTAATKERLTVDTWSGNHPAYKSQDGISVQKNPNVQSFLNRRAGY
uniref:Large ribosomal subunit protein bL31c n=1 Tax=Chromerida sp. RM11 TaxID=348535 RepID=D9IXR2_9ALVE|nr:ribosomal protein L31 [Chromerida sp. RM11]ADJ66629.1 ribosomal protein L31 [Chromerida sp. RM11]